MSTSDPQPGPRRSFVGPRILSGAILGLGLVVLYGSFQIRQGGGYSAVGPRFFPLAVAVGLLALGLIFLLRTTLIPDLDLAEHAAIEESATHWQSVGLLLAALVTYAFALQLLGYVVATALFISVVARFLGSRSVVRDLVVGVGIALVVYIGFTRFLGVRLPAGLLDFIL